MHGDFTSLTEASRQTHSDLRAWFATPLGTHVLKTEQALLEQLLPGFFGYNLVQLSVQDTPLFATSPIQTKVSLNLDTRCSASGAGVVARPAALPFASDSVDVSILHHLLDYADTSQDILKEVARVTMPMGHLVLIGFNPFSLWGAWRSLAGWKGQAPWNGRFILPSRVMDWLNLLDFKIDRAQYAIYRPPLSRFPGRVDDYSLGVSRNLNVPVGGVYVIVARKHVGAGRSIRPVWKSSRAFGRLSVVQSVEHDGVRSVEHPPTKE